MTKFLIIRFSSIGDIIQCMGILEGIRKQFPDAEIHWITRKDMASILSIDTQIHKIWAFDKATGLRGLLKMVGELKKEHFDYIYDAHSNIRSNILKFKLAPWPWGKTHTLLRSKERGKRFLLFNLRINRYDWPFKGMESFRKPLKKWGITQFPENAKPWYFPQDILHKFSETITSDTVTLVPSANWEMKRWPVAHWKKLIGLLPNHRFIVLGGPKDTFCEELRNVAPDRVINLSGHTNLSESCYLISQSNVVVSGDTGFLHAADLFRIPTLALIGPTAFGYPAGPTAEVLEVPLSCRPCTKDGRGKCKQKVYQKCMVDITPERVANRILQLLPLPQNNIN